jgi:biopolymer transport protein ExbD
MSLLDTRSPRRTAPIGLTPLIDVIFILLIFFMLASTLATREQLPIRLAAPGMRADTVPPTVHVRIDADTLWLGERSVSASALPGLLTDRSPSDTLPRIQLEPTGDVSLQRLLEILGRLRDAGLDVSLIGDDDRQ